MNKPLNQEEAVEIAGQYLPRIANAIQLGFDDYQKTLKAISIEGINPNLKIRTSACLIHDYIQDHVSREFSGDTEVKANEFNGIFGILISGKVFIRFKKLKSDLNTSNIKTDQVDQFNKQQLSLEGIETLTLLTAGYIPNTTWTAIKSICLTCKHEEDILWYKDLHSEAAQVLMFAGTVSQGQSESDIEKPSVRLKAKEKGSDKAVNE